MARHGKIARLPVRIREELNRRLLDGEHGQRLLDWLNGLPETQAVLREFFSGEPVKSQNLSEWRAGGYQDWLGRAEKIERTKELAAYAAKLAEANKGSISEGGVAIASGHLLELLEACDGKLEPETLAEVVNGIAALRRVDVQDKRVDVARERNRQTQEALELEKAKFRRHTCELFMEWCGREEAKQIATGAGNQSEKIERLGQLMFGDEWS